MQLNVLRELRQRVGSVATYDIEERLLRLNDIQLGALTGTLTLLRTDQGLLASMIATATIQERCARCLAETACTVKIDFEEEYIPVVDAATGARIRISEAEDQFRICPDFTLDLREGLRQYVLMSEPAKPLCRPDCAGLCLVCGADLNVGACGCAGEADSRWGTLARLQVKDRKGM